MKKKNALSIIMCLVMVLTILAGCGKISANADEWPDNTEATETVATAPQDLEQEATEPVTSETPENSESTTKVYLDGDEISYWYIDGVEDKDDYDNDGDTEEYVSVLVHQYGPDSENDKEIEYYFKEDSGINQYYADVIDWDESEENFLIHQEGAFYTFELWNHRLECVAEATLDWVIEDDKLFYVNIDHEEFVFDYKNNRQPQATGRKVIRYFNKSFEPEINMSFEELFQEIQEQIREGRDPKSIEIEGIKIYYDYDIFDSNGNYLGNLNYPHSYKWNRNVMFDDYYKVAMVVGNKLTYYVLGDPVKEFELPEGRWQVINSDYYVKDEAENDDSYSAITIEDESVKEAAVDEALIEKIVLMYRFDDRSVWTIDSVGRLEKVCEDVIDFQEAYGEFYWMNSKFEAYELTWKQSEESILIGENVVAISHHTDERAGFIVKPNDPRGDWESGGLHIATGYGDGWLNYEKTSFGRN